MNLKSIYGLAGEIKDKIIINIVGRIEDLYNGHYDPDIIPNITF